MACDYREIGSNTIHPGNTNVKNPVLQLLPLLSQFFTDLNKIHCRPWTYRCDDDCDDDKDKAGQIIDQNHKNEKLKRMIWVPETYWLIRIHEWFKFILAGLNIVAYGL